MLTPSDQGRLEIGFTFETSNDDVMDFLEVPSYQLEHNKMHVSDVVWGGEFIGEGKYDSLLVQLARSPLLRRLQAVEQLTLPAGYSTIPNTARFSRWQHVWGSLVFVRKMTEGDERFSERDRIVLQLRTLFSDIGQTAFSHLGDWLFQSSETSEDLHDQELRSLLESFGVEELLGQYELTLDETVFPDTKDWVECPSPDLCVDRVDYGLREILRWMSPPSPMHMYKSNFTHPKSIFTINDDDMLEIKNEDFARHFSAAYNLLPTEHWAQPVHRLQLELLQTAVKHALIDGNLSSNDYLNQDIHPRDQLYGIDYDFHHAFQDWDGVTLSEVMKTIGSAQRRIYKFARRHDIEHILRGKKLEEFPDPTTPYSWHSKKYGLVAPQIELERTDTVDRTTTLGRNGLTFGLQPLKARSLDPLVASDNESLRLSDVDDDFKTYLVSQKDTMSHSYQATLLVNKATADRLHEKFSFVKDHWEEAVKKPRSTDDLHEIVGRAALYAALFRFDRIHDSG